MMRFWWRTRLWASVIEPAPDPPQSVCCHHSHYSACLCGTGTTVRPPSAMIAGPQLRHGCQVATVESLLIITQREQREAALRETSPEITSVVTKLLEWDGQDTRFQHWITFHDWELSCGPEVTGSRGYSLRWGRSREDSLLTCFQETETFCAGWTNTEKPRALSDEDSALSAATWILIFDFHKQNFCFVLVLFYSNNRKLTGSYSDHHSLKLKYHK